MIHLGAEGKRGLVREKRESIKTGQQVQLTLGAKNILIKPRAARETSITHVATMRTVLEYL